MKILNGFLILAVVVLSGCNKDKALEPLNECLKLESEGKIEEAIKACNAAVSISSETVAGLKAQLRLKSDAFVNYEAEKPYKAIVGKWLPVDYPRNYTPKSLEFFVDKTFVQIVDKSTGEYTEAGTFLLLPDGRIKIQIGWSAGFAQYKDGKIIVEGLVYKKASSGSKAK